MPLAFCRKISCWRASDFAADHLELVPFFFAGRYLKAVTTLRTVDVLVAAHESRRHRAGRDDERFGFERPKQKRQHKGDHDRFDRFADGVRIRIARPSATDLAGSLG